jgi:hypothetical protein
MRVSAQKGTITVGMSSSNGAGISQVIFSEAKVKDFAELRGKREKELKEEEVMKVTKEKEIKTKKKKCQIK